MKLKQVLLALSSIWFLMWNTSAAVPAAPQNLTPSWLYNYWPSGFHSLLWWEPVPDATSYTIYQFDETGGMWAVSISGLTEPLHRNFMPSAPPTRYVVTASNTDGESAPSNEAVVEENMFNFTIAGEWPEYSYWSDAVTPTNAWLSWAVSQVSGADGLVELSTNGTDFATVMQNTNYLGWHNVLLTNLTPRSYYYYRVTTVGTNRGGLTQTRWFATEDTNHPPVAYAADATTFLGTPTTVSLAGNDGAGTPPYISIQSFRIVQGPTNGTLSETSIPAWNDTAGVTYTPLVNRAFEDHFLYVANDGELDSAPALVTITNIYFNRPPGGGQVLTSIVEGVTVAIELIGSDLDGDVLTFTLDTNYVALGTVTGTNSSLIYTPLPGYTGSDSFGYWVSDGTLTASGVVLIEILSTNSPPTVIGQSLTMSEDASQSITLNGSDTNGDPLTFRVTTPPANGALTGTPPNVVYQPAANYNGVDQFAFVANDGRVDSAPATISLTITAVNDPPVASNVVHVLNEDSSVIVVFRGSDPENGTMTQVILSQPAHGTLIPYNAAPLRVVYLPASNYFGPDSFTYALRDSSLTGNTATVSLTVNPRPDAPIAVAQNVSCNEEGSAVVTLTGLDGDGDALTYQLINSPAHGTLVGSPPTLLYHPFANYSGPDSFLFRASDGLSNSAPAQISITVTPVNDAPVATNQTATIDEDYPLDLNSLTASDADGDMLTFRVISGPQHGQIVSGFYNPERDYAGVDTLTFVANDGQADSAPATLSITIRNVNDPPLPNTPEASTPEDTPVNIVLTAYNPDNDPLTFVLTGTASSGTATADGTNAIFTPNPGKSGYAYFDYAVSDGTYWVTGRVVVNITSVEDVPEAYGQSVSTIEDIAVPITLAGFDGDLDPITFIVVNGPSNGSLGGSGSNLVYSPNLNFNGADSFTFKVNDGKADSAPAIVNITVAAVNDAPTLDPILNHATSEDGPAITKMLTGISSGAVNEGETITVTAVSSNPALIPNPTVTYTSPDATGSLTFRALTNANGIAFITVTVSDGTLSSSRTFNVQISALNDPPTMGPTATVHVLEDAGTQVIQLTGISGGPADEPQTVAVSIATTYEPVTGIPTLNYTSPGSTGTITFTPPANAHGLAVINVTLNDGLMSAVRPIQIWIDPVNDAPGATGQSVNMPYNTAANITLKGSDVDGNTLTYTVLSSPANGMLSGTAPNLAFTPSLNWSGTTSFNFRVNDGSPLSATATVTITVNAPTAVPPAPSGLTATAISRSRIDLAWTDNANTETGFKIERSANGTSWSQIATLGPNVTSYSSTGLSANKTYYYRVRAYNALGNSPYSNTAPVKTLR